MHCEDIGITNLELVRDANECGFNVCRAQCNRALGRLDGSNPTEMVHPASFDYQRSGNETRVVDARSRSMQPCLRNLRMLKAVRGNRAPASENCHNGR